MLFRLSRQRKDVRREQVNAAVVYAVQQNAEETFSSLKQDERLNLHAENIMVALVSVGQLLGLSGPDIERLLSLEHKGTSFTMVGMSGTEFMHAVRCCAVLHGHLALQALPMLQVPDLSHALFRTYITYSTASRPHAATGTVSNDSSGGGGGSGSPYGCRLLPGEPEPQMLRGHFIRLCRDAGFERPHGPLTTTALERIWTGCGVLCEQGHTEHMRFSEFLRALAVVAGQLKAEVFVPVAALGLAQELPGLRTVPHMHYFQHFKEAAPINAGGKWSLPHLNFESLASAVQDGRQYEYGQFVREAQQLMQQLSQQQQQQQQQYGQGGGRGQQQQWRAWAAVPPMESAGGGGAGGGAADSAGGSPRARPKSACMTLLSPYARRPRKGDPDVSANGTGTCTGAPTGSGNGSGSGGSPRNLLTGGAVMGGWVVGDQGAVGAGPYASTQAWGAATAPQDLQYDAGAGASSGRRRYGTASSSSSLAGGGGGGYSGSRGGGGEGCGRDESGAGSKEQGPCRAGVGGGGGGGGDPWVVGELRREYEGRILGLETQGSSVLQVLAQLQSQMVQLLRQQEQQQQQQQTLQQLAVQGSGDGQGSGPRHATFSFLTVPPVTMASTDSEATTPWIGSGGKIGDDATARYVVQVSTSGLRGAGTDSDVFLQLYGPRGETAEMQLEVGASDGLERGTTRTFVLPGPDVGDVQRLRVRSDGTGLAPNWHLDKLAVTSSSTGACYAFPFAGWIDSEHGLAHELACMGVALPAAAGDHALPDWPSSPTGFASGTTDGGGVSGAVTGGVSCAVRVSGDVGGGDGGGSGGGEPHPPPPQQQQFQGQVQAVTQARLSEVHAAGGGAGGGKSGSARVSETGGRAARAPSTSSVADVSLSNFHTGSPQRYSVGVADSVDSMSGVSRGGSGGGAGAGDAAMGLLTELLRRVEQLEAEAAVEGAARQAAKAAAEADAAAVLVRVPAPLLAAVRQGSTAAKGKGDGALSNVAAAAAPSAVSAAASSCAGTHGGGTDGDDGVASSPVVVLADLLAHVHARAEQASVTATGAGSQATEAALVAAAAKGQLTEAAAQAAAALAAVKKQQSRLSQMQLELKGAAVLAAEAAAAQRAQAAEVGKALQAAVKREELDAAVSARVAQAAVKTGQAAAEAEAQQAQLAEVAKALEQMVRRDELEALLAAADAAAAALKRDADARDLAAGQEVLQKQLAAAVAELKQLKLQAAEQASLLAASGSERRALSGELEQHRARVEKQLVKGKSDTEAAVASVEALLAELREHKATLAAALAGTAKSLASLRNGDDGSGRAVSSAGAKGMAGGAAGVTAARAEAAGNGPSLPEALEALREELMEMAERVVRGAGSGGALRDDEEAVTLVRATPPAGATATAPTTAVAAGSAAELQDKLAALLEEQQRQAAEMAKLRVTMAQGVTAAAAAAAAISMSGMVPGSSRNTSVSGAASSPAGPVPSASPAVAGGGPGAGPAAPWVTVGSGDEVLMRATGSGGAAASSSAGGGAGGGGGVAGSGGTSGSLEESVRAVLRPAEASGEVEALGAQQATGEEATGTGARATGAAAAVEAEAGGAAAPSSAEVNVRLRHLLKLYAMLSEDVLDRFGNMEQALVRIARQVDFVQRELKSRTDAAAAPSPRLVASYAKPGASQLEDLSVDGAMIRAAESMTQQQQREELLE